ncbi:hypothetical protein ACFL1X_13610 [Candidatus Hydrogenedentota bacterium]
MYNSRRRKAREIVLGKALHLREKEPDAPARKNPNEKTIKTCVTKFKPVMERYLECLRESFPMEELERLLKEHKKRALSNERAEVTEKDTDGDLDALVQLWLDKAEEAMGGDILDVLQDTAMAALMSTIDGWRQKLGIEEIIPESILGKLGRWATNMARRAMTAMQQFIKDKFLKNIKDCVADGKSVEEAVSETKEYLDEMDAEHAKVMAENNIRMVFYESELDMNAALGAKTKRWFTIPLLFAFLSLPCFMCMLNAGASRIPISQAFPSGAYSPPAHFRCRCHLEYSGVTQESYGEWIVNSLLGVDVLH